MTERGILNLTEVVLLARREFKVDAFVESTGGGAATIYTATIYVGPRRLDKDDPSIYRYAVAAGPGWFAGVNHTDPRAYVEEFDIGPDPAGANETVRLSAHATERTAAAIIAAYARPGLGDHEETIRAIGCGGMRRTAAYVAAVEASMDPEGIRAEIDRYFTSVCPECGKVADHRDGVHVMVDHAWEDTTVLAVGCDGYWVIDPNEVGLHEPGWADQRENVADERARLINEARRPNSCGREV